MFLRPATPADAEGIAAVHVQAWNETYRGVMPDAFLDAFSNVRSRVDVWRQRLSEPQDRWTLCVVGEHGHIFGFAVAGPAREAALTTDGEVYAINVVMRATRKGHGARLIKAMAEGLIGHGFKSAGLWVVEKNLGARWFYERLGGTASVRHERDFGGRMIAELGYVWRDVADLKRNAESLLAS